MSLRPLSSEMYKAWLPGALTAGLWAGAAAGVFYWGVQLTAPPQTLALQAVAAAESRGPSTTHVANALGQTAPVQATPVSTQFKLLGVMASASGHGSALIAMDGLPPQAYRVGQKVHEDWTLLSLTSRQAKLKSSGMELVLDLPTTESR